MGASARAKRPLGHRLAASSLAALVGVAAALVFAGPAKADPNLDEAQFFADLNLVRAKNGVPPLATDGQLINVARAWSAQMAGPAGLSHNPDLGSQVTNWRTLGENVGTGGDVASVEAALEASPHHFANMVDPAFQYVGIGVVEANGAIWVTEDFKQAKSGTLPSTQVPAPAPEPAPRPAPPAPRPAPAPAPARSAAPSTRSGLHSSAASPAAVANAAAPSAGANGASAAPTPSASPPSGSESAKSQQAGLLPPGLAVVSSSPQMDGPRAASLILFAVIAAGLVFWTQGRLPGVPTFAELTKRK